MLDREKGVALHKGKRVFSRVDQRKGMPAPGVLQRTYVINFHNHVREREWAVAPLPDDASVLQRVIPAIAGNESQHSAIICRQRNAGPGTGQSGSKNSWPRRKEQSRTGEESASGKEATTAYRRGRIGGHNGSFSRPRAEQPGEFESSAKRPA